MEGQKERLRVEHISKTFPGTKALTDVSFSIMPGEVRALVGENGAGKSTLMNIIGGVLECDMGEGAIYIDGEKMEFRIPTDAIKAGIGFVHQELSMFTHLSVAYNIFADRLPMTKYGTIDKRKLNEDARNLLKNFSLTVDPETKVGDLTIGSQQMIEIVRAISQNAKIIIFDEPTSSLSENEVDMLFKIIAQLKAQQISIIYITHKMSEIFQICDSVSILRDGHMITTFQSKDVTMEEIVNNMVGREISAYYPEKSSGVEGELLRVSDLKLGSRSKPISFTLYRKEILGFYGLIGAGRSEALKALCGIDPRSSCDIWLNGKKIVVKSYQDALKYGITYLTEDRKKTGIFPGLSVCKNMYVSNMCKEKGFWLNAADEDSKAVEAVAVHGIKTSSIDAAISSLSGGNQQKVLVARCMRVEPKVLILDEPTRGIDVNAKAEIHKKVRALAEQGIGIIVVSSEMPEIIGLCDRIVMMKDGELRGILSGEEIEEYNIIQYATGTNKMQ
ncbi:sugar ABC transporter ATP-binding protein [Lacrimispora sp. 210928-DFI.3.58]|mgnify:CR=1 FL=1|uniref:sugar ABC transporter ATP-binding protein n=1 Tax=Lacrimispora sp. 210928-DFI.3.58 TaxID=2883214 RepID=UPI0015B5E82C|nr:sugar ABC transporter ATP-binding protein [Lacrimispora sp. 210928-DFI.3.58]MCB7318554.1 sugar ABC transporter ATP-binding protein [Lacrimispora sp. 210928-DFI.3.58]